MGRGVSSKSLYLFLSAFLAGAGLSSCNWNQKEKDLNPGEVVRIQVPVFSENQYSLKIVELKTLQSLTNFTGTAAQFLMDVKPNERNDLNGRTPNFRYVRDQDGIIIPLDDQSLQMATAYAHLENLQRLEKEAGLAGVLTYPRKVVVATEIKNSQGSLENNAVYSSKFDSLLIAKYSEDALPLLANAGVIGHEHFHSLFYHLVIQPLGEKYPNSEEATLHQSAWDQVSSILGLGTIKKLSPRDAYHSTLLRGVNEGLADLWGWIYSNDDNFVGRSLPQKKLDRDLSVSATQRDGNLYPKSMITEQVEAGASAQTLEGYAYLHGVQLARALRNHIVLDSHNRGVSERDIKLQFASVLKISLAELKNKIADIAEDETLSLSQILAMILKNDVNMSSGACSSTAKLLVKEESPLQNIIDLCSEIQKKEVQTGTGRIQTSGNTEAP